MSTDGKKKRGESGQSNAKTQPFRLSGGGVWPSHLRRTLMTLPGYVERIGRLRAGLAWDRPNG